MADPTDLLETGSGASTDAPEHHRTGGNYGKGKAEIQSALSSVNQVQFDPRRTQMPTQLYVHPEDILTLFANNLASGVILKVLIRFLRMDGAIVPNLYTLVPNTDGSLSFLNIQMVEGFILGVTVYNEGNGVKRGQCYVCLALNRNGINTLAASQVLCTRYVEALPIVAWPYPAMQSASEGPGFFRTVTGSTPAAGADFSESVPARTIWRIHSLIATFTASVAVSNRETRMEVDNGAVIFGKYPTTVLATALAVQEVCWGEGLVFQNRAIAGGNNWITVPIAKGMMLRPGSRFFSNTVGISAADQWSAPQYLVEQWVEP